MASGREAVLAVQDAGAAQVARRAAPSVEEAAARGELVLIAEDNVTNQDVIRRQLNMLGYAVEVVGDGREALEALSSGRHQLLLTDCHMPEMDGYELARRIRADEEGSGTHLPIVAITASVLRGDMDQCLEAGMDDYLFKPVEMARLSETLAKVSCSPNQTAQHVTAAVIGWCNAVGQQKRRRASVFRDNPNRSPLLIGSSFVL